ncbi:DUF6875 domain-containing protein [Streptomyces sp. NBC_00057]|uniref:DUF6875 domain-containing protein n=1 Tax=Streptomyces sp. NBC_00057 TaxID=2975634 RepID=UPI00386F1823
MFCGRCGVSEIRIAMARKWMDEFLVHPHPELGREGDVCPFMSRSLSEGHAKLLPFDAREGLTALLALIGELRSELERRGESAGNRRAYLTSVIVPHGLPDDEIVALIARAHGELKGDFVERGLMLGEFWPRHDVAGLHNEAFRPLDSPLPLLAMRHMMLTDLAFLSGDHVDPEAQLTYLKHFRRLFGDTLTGSWPSRLESAEEAARRAYDSASI